MKLLASCRTIHSTAIRFFTILFDCNLIALLFPIACAAIVHYQVVHAFFNTDDFIHLFQIANDSFVNFLFDRFGSHLYIFRNLVFYLMYKLFGMHSVYYFWIVFLTHLACVFMLYRLIAIVTENIILASMAAAVWGICPINHATLSWYSAFGVLLMTFFFAWILYLVISVGKGLQQPTVLILLKLNIFMFFVGSSFSIGLSLVLGIPFLFWILLKSSRERLKVIGGTTPAFFLIAMLAISGYQPDSVIVVHDHYSITDAINFYLSNPNTMLLAILLSIGFVTYCLYCSAAFPFLFFVSDTSPSGFLTSPSGTNLLIVECVGFILIIVYLSRLLKKSFLRKQSYHFAFFFSLLIIYGSVSFGRTQFFIDHDMFSLWSTTIARYHYIGSLVMVALLSVVIIDQLEMRPILQRTLLYFFIIIILSVYPSYYNIRLFDRSNTSKIAKHFNGQAALTLYQNTISDIVEDVRMYPPNSTAFISNTMKGRFNYILFNERDFPKRAAVYTISYPDEFLLGRKVRFVEPDMELIKEFREKRQSWLVTKLLVSPNEALEMSTGLSNK